MPLELLTMLGSGIFSGLMTLFSKAMDAKRAQHEMTMRALGAQNDLWESARASPGLSFTRRTIALTVVFSIVLLPKLAALLWPDVPVVVGYTELTPGFWPFTNDTTEIKWVQAHGLAITPLDTHFVSAVVGLYFGHKVSK